MNWREQAIQEYRAALEGNHHAELERERQELNERTQRFGKLLSELLGIDVEPAGLEVTIDGATFGLVCAPEPYDQVHPPILKVVESCPRCGEKVWSRPIVSRSALGEWLCDPTRREHSCRPQPAEQDQHPIRPLPAPDSPTGKASLKSGCRPAGPAASAGQTSSASGREPCLTRSPWTK